MNDYFSTIGQELLNEIDQPPSPLYIGDNIINEGDKSMKFIKASEQHIRHSIERTKTSKGFGNDNISSYFLRLALLYIIKSFAYMFLASPWRKGSFLLFGKLLELYLFSKKEIKLPKNIICQFLSFLSFQRSLKD